MKLLLAIIIYVFSVLFVNGNSISDISKSRIDFFISDESPVFKGFRDLCINNNEVFITDNPKSRVFVYNFKKNKLVFNRQIGKHGQGPGDLSLPSYLSISNKIVVVKDQIGFSFFSLDGEYISRFRYFGLSNPFVFNNKRIYKINSSIKESHLIDSFSMEGKVVKKIGKKYLKLDLSNNRIKKNFPFFYNGIIVNKKKFLIYINKNFGDILLFNIMGNLKKKRSTKEFLDKKGILRFNNNIKTIAKGIAVKNFRLTIKPLFRDAYIGGTNLYLLSNGLKEIKIYIFDNRNLDFKKEIRLHSSNEDEFLYYGDIVETISEIKFYFIVAGEDFFVARFSIKNELIK